MACTLGLNGHIPTYPSDIEENSCKLCTFSACVPFEVEAEDRAGQKEALGDQVVEHGRHIGSRNGLVPHSKNT